mmetsp:Transcript_14893/g.32175  ORF Transcript_14893/g.32175 Transcript_14893/m.32175 type:complete len:831 (-) Transcript_14893:147-2639(-)
MGKRRNKSNKNHENQNLDEFDEGDYGSDGATSPTNINTTAEANCGGGMSRAAKKRAKKKAKTTTTTLPTSVTQDDVHKQGVTDDDVKEEKKKMQLPLDSDDEQDDVAKGGGLRGGNLMEAAKQFRKQQGEKKKKKKSKIKGDTGAGGVKGEEKAAAAVSSTAVTASASSAGAGDGNEEEDDDVDVEEPEMEPELEALLSTLTPLQILLLDESVELGEDDNKPAASMLEEAEESIMEEDKDEQTPTETDDILGDVNPLHLIGDLTTQHRARILLSSIIQPSGVSVSEFYKRYWGKRPLLAALEESEDGANENDYEDGGEDVELQQQLEHATRLNGFLHRKSIDDMIRKNKLRYGLDLNVTRYTDSLGNGTRHRITLDPPPKKRKSKTGSGGGAVDDVEYTVANPTDVWTNVDASHCTLRLLRPHEHNDNIHSMLSLLESEFGCMVGSNAYLTPLHSQGFAPHYDDVDVFILQLEGYKRWRVYAPMNKQETLPRVSSRDYTEKEVEESMGEEVLDVVLVPGDVLYLPRGWIHQAETVARPSHVSKLPGITDAHSLHLTVSAMQNWCWADFLEILMPEALESASASETSISLREGLPRNFLAYMGTMHQLDDEGGELPEGLKQVAEAYAKRVAKGADKDEEIDDEALAEVMHRQRTAALQKQFKEEAKKRIMRVAKQAMSMLDDACDQIGKRFLSDRLPPALLPHEATLTKESQSAAAHHHDASKKIWPNSLCRLVRPNIARLVIEDSKAVLYHCLDNSRVYQGTPLSPMEFEIDDAPALEQLLTTVEPHWIMVKDLIHGDVEDKMEIAQALYDEGILATMLLDTPDRSVQTG